MSGVLRFKSPDISEQFPTGMARPARHEKGFFFLVTLVVHPTCRPNSLLPEDGSASVQTVQFRMHG